jgi:hypothetical protein
MELLILETHRKTLLLVTLAYLAATAHLYHGRVTKGVDSGCNFRLVLSVAWNVMRFR